MLNYNEMILAAFFEIRISKGLTKTLSVTGCSGILSYPTLQWLIHFPLK